MRQYDRAGITPTWKLIWLEAEINIFCHDGQSRHAQAAGPFRVVGAARMRRISAASRALDGFGCLGGIDCQESLDGDRSRPDAGMVIDKAGARRCARTQDHENEANAEQSGGKYPSRISIREPCR
jgi:hypothetical protein